MPEEDQNTNRFAKGALQAVVRHVTCTGSQVVAVNIGMKVWVTKGAYEGKSGRILSQVQANPSLYTVRMDGLQGNSSSDSQFSYLALSHEPPSAPVTMPPASVTPPPQSNKRKVSQISSDLPIVTWSKSECNKVTLYAKGTAVVVMEGTYKGSLGVVQGKARAGTTVLEGQLRVLLTSPKEMNTFLPVNYLQPVSHQSNLVCEPSSPLFVSESHGGESSPTPTPAEITTIPYPSRNTSTCINVFSQLESLDSFVSQTTQPIGISVMNEPAQCTAPLIAQSMGLQCAIFTDTGDLKSLFALFH